ncbi:S26 family signal peptidase [Nocardioides terrisoli]|uniref:S26 family signal peptidase n=1 Tax=Nocardioides terrisoli TaxID=3388267 RepID=UPI0037CA5DBF
MGLITISSRLNPRHISHEADIVLQIRLLLPLATCAAAAIVARRSFATARVVGHSMEPALCDGDRVWLVRPGANHRFHVGDVIVFGHPRGHGSPPLLIKRIAEAPLDEPPLPLGSLWVLGDGESALDSRHLGPISGDAVLGVALMRGR